MFSSASSVLTRVFLGSMVLAAACGGGDGELQRLRREVAKLRDVQAVLLQRVDALEKTPAFAAGAAASLAIEPGFSPRLGKEGAPVTVVEFADFQCPYCQRAAGLPKRLVAEFPDDVLYVFKHYPLGRHHPAAVQAAKASFAAQQQSKFWEMHDLIFSGDTTQLSSEVLAGYARQLGLDMERYEQDIASPKASLMIVSDKKLARSRNAGGTPAYFVNGRRVSQDTLGAAISEEIAKHKTPATAPSAPEAGGG